MYRRVIVLSICLVFALNPAFAARRCYSQSELQAEQLLRLHSELMVIAYTCKQGSRAQDLMTYYNGFTSNNIGILHDAEQTLIRYFKIRYHDDGIEHLDDMRTKLGNEVSQTSADDSAPLFCRQYRDKVIDFFYASPSQLRGEVAHMVRTKRAYSDVCKPAAPKIETARLDKKTP